MFVLRVAGRYLQSATLADATVTIGRQSVWEQSTAGTLTAVVESARADGPHGILALRAFVELFAPDGWRMFAGYITDLAAGRMDDGRYSTRVIAAGPLGPLARTPATAAYPSQTDSERIAAVLLDGGYDAAAAGVATAIAGPVLIAHEADTRGTMLELLSAAASSGSGYLYEDHDAGVVAYQPRAMRTIEQLAAQWDTTPGDWDAAAGRVAWDAAPPLRAEPLPLPAHAIPLESLAWAVSAADMATYAEASYGTTDAGGTAVSGSTAPPVYGASIDTLLAFRADAQAVADRLTATRTAGRWMTDAITIDAAELTPGERERLRLIAVPAALVSVTMPAGAPSSELLGFVEGYTHAITAGDAGLAWTITLTVSDWRLSTPATAWDATAAVWDAVPAVWNTPNIPLG